LGGKFGKFVTIKQTQLKSKEFVLEWQLSDLLFHKFTMYSSGFIINEFK
jgi:hypothetical protein